MKIVIDITEELYEQCKDIDSIAKLKRIRKNLTDAVKYGIPIPKNHGRLIDADVLKTAFPCGESVRTECVRATIDYIPTIIDTEREDEE